MRQLTGALINNFLLMFTKLTMLYLLVIPAISLLYLSTGNEMVGGFLPLAFVLFLPSASLENAGVPFATRWSAFENTWALSPHLMVVSRYIIYIALSAIGLGLWLIVPLPFYEYFPGGTLTHLVLVGQLTVVAYYPIMYLFNPRKESFGIIVLFASMGAAAGLTILMVWLAGGNYFLMALIVAAGYAISILLAMGFNKLHMGRVV